MVSGAGKAAMLKAAMLKDEFIYPISPIYAIPPISPAPRAPRAPCSLLKGNIIHLCVWSW